MNQIYLRTLNTLLSELHANNLVLIRTKTATLAADELDTASRIWCELLEREIPLSELRNYTFEAIKAKNASLPASESNRLSRAVTAGDVFRAWCIAKQGFEEVERLQRVFAAKNCPCIDGFITVYSPVEKRDVTKPCSFHGK